MNHAGEYIALDVYHHCGGLHSVNSLWRGSVACFTTSPDLWQEYISLFETGETGTATLKLAAGVIA
jgi:hypothetical protein